MPSTGSNVPRNHSQPTATPCACRQSLQYSQRESPRRRPTLRPRSNRADAGTSPLIPTARWFSKDRPRTRRAHPATSPTRAAIQSRELRPRYAAPATSPNMKPPSESTTASFPTPVSTMRRAGPTATSPAAEEQTATSRASVCSEAQAQRAPGPQRTNAMTTRCSEPISDRPATRATQKTRSGRPFVQPPMPRSQTRRG